MIMMCARVQAKLITENQKKRKKVTARTPIYSKKLKTSFPVLINIKPNQIENTCMFQSYSYK